MFHSIYDKTVHSDISIKEYLDKCLTFSADYLYRGQGNADWELIPSSFRSQTGALLPTVDRYKRINYFYSPIFTRDFERLYLAGIDREKISVANSSGYEHLTKIAIFQHYGIPTPLLDWSDSPIVALFMATAFTPAADTRISVFRLNQVFKPAELNIIRYKDIGFERIRRQVGALSFVGRIVESGKSVHINESTHEEFIYPDRSTYPNTIERLNINIKKSDFSLIKTALHINGFTLESLFPNSPHWAARAISGELSL